MADPLDDIPNAIQKNFMKEYLRVWPYPTHTQYEKGQILNAELNGVQQRCQVVEVDSSVIQVVFQVSTITCCFFRLCTSNQILDSFFSNVFFLLCALQ